MSTNSVVVHPLVLLSAVDHYRRRGTKRVVGILLGNVDGDVHISDSFATIFEEDTDTWFLDTSYVQNMFDLFYKVNPKIKIMGWYHTGPKMYNNDLEITRSLVRFTDEPYLVIVNVHQESCDLPVQTFKLNKFKDFEHVNSSIEAEEAEEVGVEYLIKDIRKDASGSLNDKVNEIGESLQMYEFVLNEIEEYLGEVVDKTMPLNQEIIDLSQEILNSIPTLQSSLDETNAGNYVAELSKAVVSLNDYKRNRMENEKAACDTEIVT